MTSTELWTELSEYDTQALRNEMALDFYKLIMLNIVGYSIL